ncbi:MAG: RIP metalloprotease RseP [Gammaproteobacteria bacterium]|nr:RIP metalloprotease RseP [Gammaproteobacteria bacterium]
MDGFLYSVVFFVIALGLLIAIHEFGHYWVARKAGVKVLRFSIGFGKPIWQRTGKTDGTEYVLAAIPLGGYVKMLDEREGPVDEAEVHRAFNRKPLSSRVAVVAAGPLFNFAFAIIAYALIFMLGVPGLKPLVGDVISETPFARAGLQTGDEIISVDGEKTPTLEAMRLSLVGSVMKGGQVELGVRHEDQSEAVLVMDVSETPVDAIQENFLQYLGMTPLRPILPAVIGDLQADGAAVAAGFQHGDVIVRVDGQPMNDWVKWAEYVRGKPEQEIIVGIERNGAELDIRVTPARVEVQDAVIGRVGASPLVPDGLFEAYRAIQQYSLLAAIPAAISKTWDMSILTLRMMWKMLSGQASLENLSGPISIAQYAGQTAQIGIVPFLSFLAIVSVSLGVLNLLPVPILDGGHLLYYLVEFFKGSPVSEETQIIGQKIGVVMIGALMFMALFNDINRLIG